MSIHETDVESNDRFFWEEDDDVVVRKSASHTVAVYQNEFGDVVIRRQPEWHESDDAHIVVRRDQAHLVAEAILRTAGYESQESQGSATTTTKPKSSNAERQRRYRARQRDAAGVSDSNSEPNAVTGEDATQMSLAAE